MGALSGCRGKGGRGGGGAAPPGGQPGDQPPRVELRVPDEAEAGSGLLIEVEAQDDTGIERVEIRIDGKVVGSFAAPPFAVAAVVPADPKNPLLEIQAFARDLGGNETRIVKKLRILFAVPDTPPRVKIIAPSSASPGTFLSILAEASDETGVALVTFRIDGSLIAEDAESPFEALFQIPEGIAPGSRFAISATARDATGNESAAQAVVTVVGEADNLPPVIEDIAFPSEVAAGARFFLLARVRDNSGAARVQVLKGGEDSGEVLAEDASEPYSFPLTAPEDLGPFALTVRARDASGNAAARGAVIQVVAVVSGRGPSVRLLAPGQAAAGTSLLLTAEVEDPAGIESVAFFQGLTLLSEQVAPPFRFEFIVPASTPPGAILGFRARARNLLGLEAEAGAAVRIRPPRPSPVKGEVYALENGHPIAGAVAAVIGSSAAAASDANGRFALLLPEGPARLRISAPGRRPAFRSVLAEGGAPLDLISAHLPLLPKEETLSALAGGTRSDAASGAALEIDPAGLLADGPVAFSSLHPQALPDALPLGWSPLMRSRSIRRISPLPAGRD
ncbi:MAG: carboxypeptidase regulatory-like domain-containing protein [Planctomycetes bacterium]|nr:carboxypeptidase regulatory-like domain-containing protein [Planctomycetota bacterium]